MRIDAPCESHIPRLRAIWREAFGDSDAFLDRFFTLAYSPDRCRIALDSDEVVGGLYWFDYTYNGGRLAYIYAVATAKTHRGRGVCGALMNDTARHLATLGYTGAILVPAEPSLYGFYERLGYTVCSTVREFREVCGRAPVPLEGISAEEYSLRRLEFLPEGAVIQDEPHTLKLLSLEANFYSGDGFILAARKNKGELFGIELLGDASVASGILSALECECGLFRTVGDTRPFAAYLPLKDAEAPRYFGFALD